MKRDWDIVREILCKLEDLESTDDIVRLSDFPVERAFEYSYNMELLIEAGLVDGQMSKTLGRGAAHFMARRLTWVGHEFLDAVRSNTVWSKTKRTFAEQGLGMTFDMAKTVATRFALAMIPGLPG